LVSAIAPVIVHGNTCVVVVDSAAPHLAIELGEVLATSDLPGGVVNLITGGREELLPHAVGHMDVDGIAAYGCTADEMKAVGVEGAESVKRVRCYDDPTPAQWRAEGEQSPYRILDFVEFKTAWHPIGV
ncbi:MAG: aldehyde dehydrogenase family protein, partial [Myxococcota bacterium]|nr:aldehyde dehydrogenase family protein [Myxococcota bacterium]